MKKIGWGVLGTSYFATHKMIPSMKRSRLADVAAVASRDLDKAKKTARELDIAKAYGSYEKLLNDPDIQAVYIPLPNHLHVEWTIHALRAGKHVLCEKPIALDAAEARRLVREAKKHPRLKVMEAFMYRFHTQWPLAHRLVRDGRLGGIKTVHAGFAIDNRDPGNIRNRVECGGGALLDLGCYCVSFARFLFGVEPKRILGRMEIDPVFKTDVLTSGMLDFGIGTATFTCSTKLIPFQRVHVHGNAGWMEIVTPVGALPDKPVLIRLQTRDGMEEISIDACDHYAEQADRFCEAVLEDKDVPTPLSDAVANMKVLDAVKESHKRNAWIKIS
ncbi:MAG TPA: Gfo/Idh/MocA family oxidoreductase [bacterium]